MYVEFLTHSECPQQQSLHTVGGMYNMQFGEPMDLDTHSGIPDEE